jgi:Ser/Thr protein kinase RdoA (MazF antagonist)
MNDFFGLPKEEQAKDLEKFASKILEQYAMDIRSITSINYEYNATFKVEAGDGRLFALRININSARSPKNLMAEIAWVRSLSNEGQVNVPKPIQTTSGGFYTSAFHEPSQRTLHCVLYSWLEGKEVGDPPTFEQLRQLGAAMATMHISSKNFVLSADSELPHFSDPMWETEDFLLGENSSLDVPTRELISQAMNVIAVDTKRLFAENQSQIIHADLHGWNLMWDEEVLSIFDFDDCGIGLPIQDLATALYYLDTPEQDAALLEGYESVAPLPKHTKRDMEMLLLQRRIILLNYLYETLNAEHANMLPEYLEETIRRVKVFLEI